MPNGQGQPSKPTDNEQHNTSPTSPSLGKLAPRRKNNLTRGRFKGHHYKASKGISLDSDLQACLDIWSSEDKPGFANLDFPELDSALQRRIAGIPLNPNTGVKIAQIYLYLRGIDPLWVSDKPNTHEHSDGKSRPFAYFSWAEATVKNNHDRGWYSRDLISPDGCVDIQGDIGCSRRAINLYSTIEASDAHLTKVNKRSKELGREIISKIPKYLCAQYPNHNIRNHSLTFLKTMGLDKEFSEPLFFTEDTIGVFKANAAGMPFASTNGVWVVNNEELTRRLNSNIEDYTPGFSVKSFLVDSDVYTNDDVLLAACRTAFVNACDRIGYFKGNTFFPKVGLDEYLIYQEGASYRKFLKDGGQYYVLFSPGEFVEDALRKTIKRYKDSPDKLRIFASRLAREIGKSFYAKATIQHYYDTYYYLWDAAGMGQPRFETYCREGLANLTKQAKESLPSDLAHAKEDSEAGRQINPYYQKHLLTDLPHENEDPLYFMPHPGTEQISVENFFVERIVDYVFRGRHVNIDETIYGYNSITGVWEAWGESRTNQFIWDELKKVWAKTRSGQSMKKDFAQEKHRRDCYKIWKNHNVISRKEFLGEGYTPKYGFTNGVLDLKTLEFLPHSKENKIFFRIEQEYNQSLYPQTPECWMQTLKKYNPRFYHFLTHNLTPLRYRQAADDPDHPNYEDFLKIAEYLRAILKLMIERQDNYNHAQKFIKLTGPSGSGKSLLLELLSKFYPGQVASGNLDFEDPDKLYQRLHGKHLYICDDLGKITYSLNPFYSLVSNSLVDGRKLHSSENKTYAWDVFFVVASVKAPVFPGEADEGYARRLLPLHTFSIGDAELVDDQFKTQLLEEPLGTLIAWAVTMERSSMLEYVKQKVDVLPENALTMKESKLQNSSVLNFLDCCTQSILVDYSEDAVLEELEVRRIDYPHRKSTVAHYYKLYKAYCKETGTKPKSYKNFQEEVFSTLPNCCSSERFNWKTVEKKALAEIDGADTFRPSDYLLGVQPIRDLFSDGDEFLDPRNSEVSLDASLMITGNLEDLKVLIVEHKKKNTQGFPAYRFRRSGAVSGIDS